jgi:hypothetical protein
MNIKRISKRAFAYIILKVSGTLGGGFVFGIEVWQAAAMAAFIGLMDISEELSRAYVQDGEISAEDEDAIFGAMANDEDPDLGQD